jgi:hypothetical protein
MHDRALFETAHPIWCKSPYSPSLQARPASRAGAPIIQRRSFAYCRAHSWYGLRQVVFGKLPAPTKRHIRRPRA